MLFVVGGGIKGKEAMEAVTFAAKASAAGLGETKVVADALTSAMNAYGVANLTAEQATNVLVATVREGKAEADSIAGAIGRVIPIASQLGVQFYEVGAAIAGMTRIGLGAEESVVALRGLLNAIVQEAAEGAVELDKVGLSYQELRDILGKPNGLLNVMTILSEKFGDNVSGLGKVIGNVRALTGQFALTGKNAEIVSQIFTTMSKEVGTTEKSFNEGADTIERKWNKAMAELEVSAIKVAEAFKNEFSVAITGMAQFLKDSTPQIVAFLKSITDHIKDLVRVYGSLKGIAIGGRIGATLGGAPGALIGGAIGGLGGAFLPEAASSVIGAMSKTDLDVLNQQIEHVKSSLKDLNELSEGIFLAAKRRGKEVNPAGLEQLNE